MSLVLLDLQRGFHAPDSPVMPWVVGNGMEPDVRLGIYRNHTSSNLCEALQSDYAVVERLVGKEFFNFMARAYIVDTPSRSGDVNDYGEDFPGFIAEFSPVASLPYLADVARLEQAWKQCFYAADEEPLNGSLLGALPAERVPELCLELQPGLRLLSSEYPVTRIWSVNQADTAPEDEILIDAGAEWILLQRVEGQVQINQLPQIEFVWLKALSEGSTLAEAVEAAFAVSDAFDLANCLQRYLAQGVFADYTFKEN